MTNFVRWLKSLWSSSRARSQPRPEPMFDHTPYRIPTPGISEREKCIRMARTKISDAMLTAFFRAIPPEESSPGFVIIIKNDIESRENLDDIFCYGDGDEFGYRLEVTPTGDNQFQIEVGYLAGELCGDGGAWDVTFDNDGQVIKITGGLSWIS